MGWKDWRPVMEREKMLFREEEFSLNVRNSQTHLLLWIIFLDAVTPTEDAEGQSVPDLCSTLHPNVVKPWKALT
ncbi:hypothetical protein DV515_00008053 [Chloebia gouldiae]|uniref:Uncharacterized protein n=1 Tax=Chloebia gouldiae TaxID=44316 RepID=A0A3L8SFF0_CHLGU|nr:hypothetical protein DV515_00008053 [Chloebia gouldiae]